MQKLRWFFVILLAPLAGCGEDDPTGVSEVPRGRPVLPSPGEAGFAYVTNLSSANVSVIDIATNTVIAKRSPRPSVSEMGRQRWR